MNGPRLHGGTKPDGYICFAAQDWWYHSQAHSDFQMMRHLARRHPVLVVNSLGLRMPLPGRTSKPLRRVVRKAHSIARSVRTPLSDLPNFRVMSPVALPIYGSSYLARLNARSVASQVNAASARMGMARPVCVVTIPTAEPILRHLRHQGLVVNRADKHSEFGEADREQIERLEGRLLRSADAVIYASHALMAADSPLVGSRGQYIDHGVDLDLFTRRSCDEEPEDLRAIPHPRVGFFGTLDGLVDYELLSLVATELPEVSLVLVGLVTVDLGRLPDLPNVHVLGQRSYSDVPRYGSGFDVAIMPWRTTEWIRWCNPIKLKEYLALGLPVVSIAFPEIEDYRDVVRVARDSHSFLAEVRAALVMGRDERQEAVRRARVADASWSGRATQLERLCGQLSQTSTGHDDGRRLPLRQARRALDDINRPAAAPEGDPA